MAAVTVAGRAVVMRSRLLESALMTVGLRFIAAQGKVTVDLGSAPTPRQITFLMPDDSAQTFYVYVRGAVVGLVDISKHGDWRAHRIFPVYNTSSSAYKPKQHRTRVDAALELLEVSLLYKNLEAKK